MPSFTKVRGLVVTPSLSKGALAKPRFKCGVSVILILGDMTCLPKLSNKNEDLRYRLPPEIAEIKLEIRPDANGASNKTGTCAVLMVRLPKRRTARTPATRPILAGLSKSSAARV